MKMNMYVNDYIKRINNNDPTLTEIKIIYQKIDDAAIAPLMAAFAQNPAAAQRIISLELGYNWLTNLNVQCLLALQGLSIFRNQLTSINVQGLRALKVIRLFGNQLTSINVHGLDALVKLSLSGNQITSINVHDLETLELHLDNNPLTAASVIALEALRETKPNLLIAHNYPQFNAKTLLTNEMLDLHFKPMLTIKRDSMNSYIDKAIVMLASSLSGLASSELLAPKTLLDLPIELMRKILRHAIPEVAQARASMNNFKSIFSNLPIAPWPENHQLNTLIAYEEKVLKKLIESTEQSYDNMFTKLQKSCELIRKKRNVSKNTECGFKSGFINTRRKLGLF